MTDITLTEAEAQALLRCLNDRGGRPDRRGQARQRIADAIGEIEGT
jgi:hypothetical protein